VRAVTSADWSTTGIRAGQLVQFSTHTKIALWPNFVLRTKGLWSIDQTEATPSNGGVLGEEELPYVQNQA